jgi:hypothetical protein
MIVVEIEMVGFGENLGMEEAFSEMEEAFP